MRRIVLLALLLGCASVEVRDRPMGHRRFMVEAEGNRYASAGDVLGGLHERAGALCPDGYEIEDDARDTNRQAHVVGSTVLVIRTHEIAAIVRCTEGAPHD